MIHVEVDGIREDCRLYVKELKKILPFIKFEVDRSNNRWRYPRLIIVPQFNIDDQIEWREKHLYPEDFI